MNLHGFFINILKKEVQLTIKNILTIITDILGDDYKICNFGKKWVCIHNLHKLKFSIIFLRFLLKKKFQNFRNSFISFSKFSRIIF